MRNMPPKIGGIFCTAATVIALLLLVSERINYLFDENNVIITIWKKSFASVA